jgi:hypothetical protein
MVTKGLKDVGNLLIDSFHNFNFKPEIVKLNVKGCQERGNQARDNSLCWAILTVEIIC